MMKDKRKWIAAHMGDLVMGGFFTVLGVVLLIKGAYGLGSIIGGIGVIILVVGSKN